jgi:hypothetical protein
VPQVVLLDVVLTTENAKMILGFCLKIRKLWVLCWIPGCILLSSITSLLFITPVYATHSINSSDQNTVLFGNILALTLALLIIPGICYLYFRRAYRMQNQWLKKYSIPKLIDSPPDSLPPAFVCLLRGYLRTGDSVLATIYDLAKNNIIRVEQRIESGKSRLPAFVKVNYKEQFQFEKVITQKPNSNIRDVFNSTGFGRLKDSKYVKLVEEEAISQGFFNERPLKTQNRLVFAIMFPLWILAFLFLGIWIKYFQDVALGWLPVLSIWITGFIPVLIGSTRLTEKGFEEATKWRSFYRYFKKTLRQNKLTDLEISKWNDYLPYAQAFLLTKKWLKVARKHSITPPSWYYIIVENDESKHRISPMKTDSQYFHEMINWLYVIFNDHR